MRIRLVLAFACVAGLLLNTSMADNVVRLFAGPPSATQPSTVKLTVHQQPVDLPFEVNEAPPVPVPVPMAEPDLDEEPPVEPGVIPAPSLEAVEAPMPEMPATELTEPAGIPSPELGPVEVPMPEVPAEPPVKLETPDDHDVPKESPMRRQSPRLAPPDSAYDDGIVPTPDPAAGRLPEPSPIDLPEFTYEEPMVSYDAGCSSRGLRMPHISRADRALPTLPQSCTFDELGIELGGWLEVGFSAVGTSPEDRFNGPVTFNDRHAEAQMNQLWFYLEREPDTWACSPDLGGRIDVMYGTDAQYIQAGDGLESNWDQSERFYQIALPQFYLDATYSGWKVRMGRFFTILGHEGPAAPDNFFYSHAYTMQYGEPFTHTGMLVSRRFGQWLLNAGIHRGNDQFDDSDGLDAINVLGGIGYTTPGDFASVEYAFSSAESGPDVPSYTHSLVNTVHITDQLDYVLQGDYGEIWNPNLRRTASRASSARPMPRT